MRVNRLAIHYVEAALPLLPVQESFLWKSIRLIVDLHAIRSSYL